MFHKWGKLYNGSVTPEQRKYFLQLKLINEDIFNSIFSQVEICTATITSSSPIPGERPIIDFAGPPHSGGHPNSASASINRMRKKSSGKKRLEKSYSTESSLNHLVPNSPVHPSRSAKQRYSQLSTYKCFIPTK